MPIFIKGRHFSFPPKLKIHIDPKWEKWEIKMTRPHDVKDKKEQGDWLKICGLAWSLSARKISTMMAGRWNTETEEWEFTPYTHIKGVSQPVYGQPIFSCKVNTFMEVFVRVDRKTKEYGWLIYVDGKKVAEKVVNFKHNRWLARQVSPWAGGTKVSPATYYFRSKNRPV